jgi:CTP synthase (UTP-ammonia lyase)
VAARAIRIGILGDFNAEYRSHLATNAALRHAAQALSRQAEATWIPTPSLLEPDAERTLESFDGLWASPGSPYRSIDGMLAGIRFARVRNWPFVAT